MKAFVIVILSISQIYCHTQNGFSQLGAIKQNNRNPNNQRFHQSDPRYKDIAKTAFQKHDPTFDCSNSFPGPYSAGPCENFFFVCAVGIDKAFIQPCSPGLKYNAEGNRCDVPAYIPACGGEEHEYATFQPRTNALPDFECAIPGYSQDPRDEAQTQWGSCSSTYYYCPAQGQMPDEFHCSSGLVYDIDSQQCLYFSDVYSCTGKNVIPQGSEPARPADAQKKPAKSNFVGNAQNGFCDLRIPATYPLKQGQCASEFVHCQGTIGKIFTCDTGKGEVYDEINNKCEFRQNLEVCGGAPKKMAQNKNFDFQAEAQISLFPGACKQWGYMVDPREEYQTPWGACSNNYFYCSGPDASPVTQQCPFSLMYDVEAGICDIKVMIYACSGRRRNGDNNSELPRVASVTHMPRENRPNFARHHEQLAELEDQQRQQLQDFIQIEADTFCQKRQAGSFNWKGGCLQTFIICSLQKQMTGHVLYCPDNLVFNEKTQSCVDRSTCEI